MKSERPGLRPFWWIAILLGGAVALLVVGVAVALLAGRQPEAGFAPNSPEGTVTAYLRFLQNGQGDEAFALSALEEGPPTTGPMTRERFHAQFDAWSQTPHRVTLLRSSVTGDKASVTVEISTFSPDVFGSPDRTVQQTFTLTQRNGAWLITGPLHLF